MHFSCTRRHFRNAPVALVIAAFICGGPHARARLVGSSDIPQNQQPSGRVRAEKEIALANAYLKGDGVPQDLRLAAFWYEKAAGYGDPLAQNLIGYCYQTGMGVQVDAVRAVHWYQLASSNGLIVGKVNLAVSYLFGTGVERKTETAEKLLVEAANNGSGTASAYLGEMYLFGIGVGQDKAAAEKWYEKGIKLHSYLAAFRIGAILSAPDTHPQDLNRALSLFRQAASVGFVPAMHSAGLLLVNHPALCTSRDEALSFLDQAASAGNWKSSLALGALARDGEWMPQDSHSAYFHFRVGVLQGGEDARALAQNDLKILSGKLSDDERKALDAQADAWTQKHNRTLTILYQNHEDATTFPAFALALPEPGSHAGPLIPVAPF
jgi:TPR repeat protein